MEKALSEGNDMFTRMDIDMIMEKASAPMEDVQEKQKNTENSEVQPTKSGRKQPEEQHYVKAPQEQRTRKHRGPKDDPVISSNFSKNKVNQQNKKEQQEGEGEQHEENSPTKVNKYQQKEAEMMELLSSIIMDASTTAEQDQEQKIQQLIQGIYKDIKPEQKNIQPKKKFTFARLPKLQNNEPKLISKYIQALNTTGKAALFQVKRHLKEWLLGVAKYRWNMEDLLEDRTRQLLVPKDQAIQFAPNFKKALTPTTENQDIASRYVFTFLTNCYTEEEKVQLQKTCTTQMSRPDTIERRQPTVEEEKAIMGLYSGLFTCRPLPQFVYHILTPLNVHRFEEHIAREVDGELMIHLPATMKIDPQVYHSRRIAADILSEMSRRNCPQETKEMLDHLLKMGKVFSYHPERHSIHVSFDTKQQASMFAGLEVPFKNQFHSLQVVNYEKSSVKATGGIRKFTRRVFQKVIHLRIHGIHQHMYVPALIKFLEFKLQAKIHLSWKLLGSGVFSGQNYAMEILAKTDKPTNDLDKILYIHWDKVKLVIQHNTLSKIFCQVILKIKIYENNNSFLCAVMPCGLMSLSSWKFWRFS